ncbi:hypothetical protein [Saccharospirillum salsuginis]|uniref:Uncharacterized protein n=1 Tax=Saccharospirillum salsuginis TaxID=418750 RepID=A0A918K1X1_9GAMM|nr:hypothetical protein [Saccharospirillum salsuginis]GGX40162.1 hypothetical protein GCM10007392_03520 [Saccharospirillum salsuginis]
MKRLLILLASAVVISTAVLGLAALRPTPESDPTLQVSNRAVDADPEETVRTSRSSSRSPAASPEPVADDRESQPLTRADRDGSSSTDTAPANEPDFEQMLQQPLQQVAAAYAEQNRFPTFSQPIESPAELLRYKPHQPQTVSLPFPTPNGGTYQANVTLDQYRYFKGDRQQLTLDLSTSGGTFISDVQATVTTVEGDELYRLPLHVGPGTRIDHSQTVDLSDAWQDWPMELQWTVRARVGEQRLSVVAPFRYETPVAVLEGVGASRVEGEFLTIPLAIETDFPGYYFVQANLYSKDGSPLIHLQTEGPLTPNHPPLTLRASGAIFRHLNDAGPYVLRDVQVERLGGDALPDRFGQARRSEYAVTGFPLNDYADSTWTDTLAQQRLDFLESLGGTDSPN